MMAAKIVVLPRIGVVEGKQGVGWFLIQKLSMKVNNPSFPSFGGEISVHV